MKLKVSSVTHAKSIYLLMHVHGCTEGKKNAGDHRARVSHKHSKVLHIHGHVTLPIPALTESKAEGGPVDNEAPLLYVNTQLCISQTDTVTRTNIHTLFP